MQNSRHEQGRAPRGAAPRREPFEGDRRPTASPPSPAFVGARVRARMHAHCQGTAFVPPHARAAERSPLRAPRPPALPAAAVWRHARPARAALSPLLAPPLPAPRGARHLLYMYADCRGACGRPPCDSRVIVLSLRPPPRPLAPPSFAPVPPRRGARPRARRGRGANAGPPAAPPAPSRTVP
ncbi:MAG: hypothetical protein J3K34DRAFT_78904 [Monoraphidium minutum]|nr:MAG: hypothetical protein J3K34DRAFT_78904 [Monoraphidium minutum]